MFFPERNETLTSQFSDLEVMKNIDQDIQNRDIETKNWFKGDITSNVFKISLLLKRPNNFTPIISGIIERADGGKTLIVVKYELFPATKKFLVFWTIITLLLTLFFTIPYNAYLYAAITFSAGLVNYIITRENFNIQVRKSRRALKKVVGGDD